MVCSPVPTPHEQASNALRDLGGARALRERRREATRPTHSHSSIATTLAAATAPAQGATTNENTTNVVAARATPSMPMATSESSFACLSRASLSPCRKRARWWTTGAMSKSEATAEAANAMM